MSKKVLFYLVLDSLGIALTTFIGKWLCEMCDAVTNLWVSNGISLIINFLCACVTIFIIFFFLLYWWSDRKWSKIKRWFKNKKSYLTDKNLNI